MVGELPRCLTVKFMSIRQVAINAAPAAATAVLLLLQWQFAYLRNRLPVEGGCVYVLHMFFCFFFVRQKYETTVLGNG